MNRRASRGGSIGRIVFRRAALSPFSWRNSILSAGRQSGNTGSPFLCAILLFILLSTSANAYDPLTLPSSEIRSFQIEGNEVLSDSEIRDIMRLTRGGWFHSGRYRVKWLNKDLDELIRYYHRLGYLDAEVAERNAEIDREDQSAAIVIRIQEGEQVRVGGVRLEGLPDLPMGDVEPKLSLRRGKPFNRELLDRDQIQVYSILAENGFPEAEVTYVETLTGNRADLTITIEPGPRVQIGRVTIEGTEKTRPEFVFRELTFKEGEWFSRTKMLKSRDRIFQTGLYINVAMTRGELEQDKTVPIRVIVKEKRVRWFGFGVGFGTEDLLRLSTDWTNRNWLRTGRRINMEAVLSELFANRKVEQRYEASLIEPWMFRTRTAGILKLSHERLNMENYIVNEGEESEKILDWYRLIQTSASFALSRELNDYTKGWIKYSMEWADVTDASEDVDYEGIRPEVTRALSFTFERDARDHLLDPSRGSRTHISIEYAGTFLGGDNDFLKTHAGGSIYKKISKRTLIALRAQSGGIHSFALDKAIPDYKRFRLGGANSVRGFREESIGPLNYMMLGGVELRIGLFWRLGMVLFADAGGGWQHMRDMKFSDILPREGAEVNSKDPVRCGFGGGLRLFTPVGPIRFDYGQKLNRRVDDSGERESDYVLHFSIGQAF